MQRAEREKAVAVERAIKAEQERNLPAPPRGKGDDNEGGITNKDLQMQLNPHYELETQVYNCLLYTSPSPRD